MHIIYDNIIYSLQKSGGISVYWQMLENKMPISQCYTYNSCSQNICYHKKDNEIKQNKNIFLQRYCNPRINLHQPFIFHSSYYRYCPNKNAINITTVHDFTYELFRKDIKSLAHKMQKRNTVMHSDGIICISENTLSDFKKFYPNYKGLTKVIYHGYDNTIYHWNNLHKNNEVLFVGSRVSYKRFDLAVALVQSFKDLTLTIVGGGDLTPSEIKLLNQCLPNRYKKIGFVSGEQLSYLYNTSFALAYTSDYEGFGFPILEAQACGCPVIAQPKSTIPEIASIFISVDKNDKETSIQNISKLFDVKIYSDIQQQGLKNVERFCWDNTVTETKAFYNEVYHSKVKQ